MPVPQRRPRHIAVALEPGEPLQAECQHFLDCVEIGATPRTDGREGLRVLSVLTRASASLQSAAAQGTKSALNKAAPAKPSAAERFPKAKIHELVYVDEDVEIGDNTSIWHFSHVLGRVKIGPDCVIGQNVIIGPDVTIGDALQDSEQRIGLQGRHARGWRVLRAILRVHQCQQSARRNRAQE